MKFLYVDDQPDNVRLMRGMLCERLGCEMVHANTASEALRYLETMYDISCILTDLNLPGSSGLVFLQRLYSNPGWRKIPIIVCTNETKRSTVMEVARVGVRNYLCKPITLEKLSAKLCTALSTSQFEIPHRMGLLLDLGLSSNELDELQFQARKDLERIVAKKFSDRSWEERQDIMAKLWPWTESDDGVEGSFREKSA